jgi:ribose transport system ATP-binding protein
MAAIDRFTSFGFLRASREKGIGTKHVLSLKIKTPNVKVAIKNLSGGNQQKAIVGRWLEVAPSIFIMDEPTKGIDVGAKYEIYLLMKEIAEKGGAVILISSELPEVLHMSNRVLTIYDGRITGEFDPETVPADTIMRAALGLGGAS